MRQFGGDLLASRVGFVESLSSEKRKTDRQMNGETDRKKRRSRKRLSGNCGGSSISSDKRVLEWREREPSSSYSRHQRSHGRLKM